MSTHSRLHGSTSYRVPWLFEEDTPDDPENACAVLRHFVKLKGRLMPYLYAQAVKTATEGVPMMRAMVLDYADDPACLTLDRQYTFGDNLLCAPVFSPDGEVTFYVPEGVWTDVLTGKTYEGRRYYTEKCSYLEMPILAKPNTVTVYGAFARSFEYDYVTDAEAVIYRLEEGKTAATTVYRVGGAVGLTLSVTRTGGALTVKYASDAPFRLRVEGKTLSLGATAMEEREAVFSLD
jgi:alpha-D-xyloside xylohydrolase